MPYEQDGRLGTVITPLKLDVLRFRQMTAVEGVSELFRYTLTLESDLDATIEAPELVGQKMTVCLDLAADDKSRYFHGIVSRIGLVDVDARFKTFRIELVPWLWLLTRTSDCRIFQAQSAREIIEEIFGEYDFADFEFRSVSPPEQRTYCVQYRETDFVFVSRLLESEGIGYFFEHTKEGHKLVLFDKPAENKVLEHQPAAHYRPSEGLDYLADVIVAWRVAHELRPGKYAVQDYNFEDPGTNLHAQAGSAVTAGGSDRFELYEYPAGHANTQGGDSLAEIRMQQEAAGALTIAGASSCRAFAPGYRFDLKQHEVSAFNDKPYLLTRVTHEVSVSGYEATQARTSYENTFEAIPHEVPFRPYRSTPRPAIHGIQTAVVVGRSGEEIFTDKLGRIKVQFHWDRKGEANEESSCWIRVGQTWAGKQWGAVFLPRVGQEVIVEFLEGDPDKPLVTGCVYNAQYMPPYELPGEKTKSSIKSQSSKGGGGFNEIRFEDKKGEEQVFVFAEKDLDMRVQHDTYEHVGNDRHLIVKRDQVEHIENDLHEKVDRHRTTEIAGDQNVKIKGKQAIEIADSSSFTIKGDVIEVFKANHSEQTTGSYYLKAKQIVIESTTGVTLKCGGSAVVIDSAGVTLKGNMLTLDGSMVKIASGPGSPPLSGSAGKAVVPAAPASPVEAAVAVAGMVGVAAAKEVAAAKAAVSAAKPFRSSDEEDKTWVEIELVDEAGEPIAGEKYEIKLPDGSVASGTTGADGIARLEGIDPGDCEVTFPNLDKDAWEPA
ncbi:MAG: type VI secretion system tip protein TssI/VgrG [Planctomycetota bacterium]